MTDIWAFDERSVREIAEAVRKSQRDIRQLQGALANRVGQPVGKMHVCRTGAATIPAMTGLTPGVGQVSLIKFNKDQDLELSALKRTVHNISNQPIAANAYGLIWQELLSGRFVSFNLPGLVRFQLIAPLILGTEAAAKTVEWNGVAYALTTNEIIVKDFTTNPGSWSGASGHTGWAWLPPDNDNGKYEIVWMENVARFIEFTSIEDMGYTTAGQMAATLDAWYDIKMPTAAPIIVTDPRGLFVRAMSGAKGKAWYNPKTDKYVIVECQTKAGRIRGTLNAGFTAGSSAGASVSSYGGTQQDVQNPNGPLTVYDPMTKWPRAQIGAKFEAELDSVSGHYNVTYCEQIGITATATITSDLCGSSSVGIDNFEITSPTPLNLTPVVLPATASNPRGHGGRSGAKVGLQWNEVTNSWDIIDIEGVDAKVLVNLGGSGPLRVNPTTGDLEGYMVTIRIESCADPEWEAIDTTYNCGGE